MMWGQFSQVKVKVLYRTVFTSDTSPNSGILRSLTLLTNLSPKVYNLLRTQERAIIMINYSCITKDTNEEQPNEDMHRMISGKVLNVKVVPSTGESLEIQMAKFFIGISLCKHDWLNHWPHDQTQFSFSSLPKGWDNIMSPSNNMVRLSRMANHLLKLSRGLPWVNSISINSPWAQGALTVTNKDSYYSRNSKGLGAPSQEQGQRPAKFLIM